MESSHIFRRLFIETGAVQDAHYEYMPGRHARFHIDFARVIQIPNLTSIIAHKLYKFFEKESPSIILTPNAADGVVFASIVAEKFNARLIKAIRANGVIHLPDYLELKRDDSVLIVDDGINTGNSISQLVTSIESSKAMCCGVSVCIRRDADSLNLSDVVIKEMFDLSSEYPIVNQQCCDQCKIFSNIEKRLAYEVDGELRKELTKEKMTLEVQPAYHDWYRDRGV